MSDVATMLSAEDSLPVPEQEVAPLVVDHEEAFDLVDKAVSGDASQEEEDGVGGQLSSSDEADHSVENGGEEAHDARSAPELQVEEAVPLSASESEPEEEEQEVDEEEVAADAVEEEAVVEEVVDTGPAHPSKLYFVRYPKPDLSDLDIEIEKVKAVFASYKEGFQMILATLKVQQVNQNEAKRELDAATEVFETSADEQRKWRDELAPLRNADKIVSERRYKMRDNVKDLPARSEAELDAKIQELEFTLDHTTIPRAQEDKLIKEISRLSKSRPEVRKIEAEFAAVESSKEQLSEFAASKQELEKKVSIIADEVTQAKEVRQERWLVLQGIRDKVTLLSNEMKAMRAQKDEQWAALNKLRDARKRKLDVYYANRRFSQSVRQQLAGGQVQEAVDACAELNTRVIGKLVEDAEYRAEYCELWEMQRTYAVSQAAIDLDPMPTKGKKAKAVTNGNATSGKDKAARIIEDLLLEAERELGKAPPSNGSATRSSLLASTPAPAAHKSTNGAARSAPAEAAADKPAPVARSAPKAKAPAPAPVRAVREPEAFELPEAISQPAAEQASAAHAKAALQADQRAKAADAARKKKEKEDAKTRKAQKAVEAAQSKQDAEAAKAQTQAALVKRNADEQRAKAAKKKEADARRLEKMELQKQTRTMRTKEAPASKPRPTKATMVTKAQKICKDNYAMGGAALGVAVVALAAIAYVA